MTISRSDLATWPHKGQPSSRHVWKCLRLTDRTGAVEKCQRCDRVFIEKADTRGPVYCYPTTTWLAANPTDNGWLGPVKTPFG